MMENLNENEDNVKSFQHFESKMRMSRFVYEP